MKKRIASLFVVICLLLTMLPTVASAAGGNGISINATQVKKGDTLTVTLEIPAISEPLSNLEFNISFDKDVFEVTEYTKPAFAAMSNTPTEANAAGRLTCSNASSTGDNDITALQSGGTMTATFQVKDTASSGSYTFTVSKYETKSIDENTYLPIDRAPAGTVKSASITVISELTGTLAITGMVAPAKDAAPIEADDLTASTGAVISSLTWDPAHAAFAAGPAYTATINVKADTGYVFADGVTFTVNGEAWDAEKQADGSYNLTKTFPALGKDALTGTPTISGTVKVGETLTAVVTGLSDSTNITYQWCADGTDISGATSGTYKLTANEAGKTITVKVTATGASQYTGTVTSAATAAVANAAQAAPTLQNSDITATTDTTITVTANNAWEYSKDGSSWQSSNVFTGLNPDTTYNIYVRLMAKTGYDASPASNAISGKTTKAQIAESAKGTLAGYTGTYDGAAHDAITGAPADGHTVQYSTTSADSGFSSTMPKVTNVVDSGKVWVKLSKTGYEDKVFEFTTSVSAKNISSADITLGTQETYTGSAQNVVITSVTVDGKTLTKDTDYTITSGSSAINVAATTLTIIGKGNYTGTASTQWTLQKATPVVGDFTVTPPSAVTYGSAVSVTAPTTTKNGMGAVSVKYNGETTAPTYVGSYTVTFDVAEGDNYKAATGLSIGTLTINPAAQTITATSATQTIIKNGVGVDISGWASSNAPGANLVYSLEGSPAGITLSGNTLSAANADSTVSSFTIKVSSAAVDVNSDSTNEYDAATGVSITVTVSAKADADVNITATPTSKTYGDANFTLTATKADAATGGTWAWTSSDSTILEIVSGADTATATIAVKKADTTGAIITVTYTSDSHYDAATATIKVDPKTLTAADLEYTGAAITKVYDGNATCTLTQVSVKDSALVGTDTLSITGTAVYNSADVATANKVTFTPDAITSGNYALASTETLDISATITKAALTVEGTATATAVYGTKLNAITISGLTVKFGGSDVPGTWAFSGETVLDVGTTAAQTATFTPTSGAGNYNVLTKEIVPTITQATYGNKTENGSAKYGAAGTVDLTNLIVEGGTAIYQSHTNTNSALDGTPSVSGKTLNFKFVDNAALATKTEQIVVKVTSTNYADYTITVTVTVNNKTTPTVTAPTAKTDLVYDGSAQTLINAGSTNGGELQYSLTSGSGYSTELPKATNAGDYTVYYKVVGDADYADVAENSFTVKIEKKDVTVAPKNVTITKGNAIPTFELTYTGLVGGDTLTPSTAPIFTCFEADGTTAVSTSTAAGTYTITWTNKDSVSFTGADNYNIIKTETGTLKINSSYSGGGGGSVATYAIVVEDSDNGEISASKKSASKGTDITLTVKADEGYELDTLKVLDKNGDKVKVTKKGDKYTFKMPASKVTVEATFAKIEVEPTFDDVAEDAYYFVPVEWAVEEGITSGTSATTFSPNATCTRAQAVTFLWRAAGSPEPMSTEMPFEDVAAEAYYYDAVLWAVENGITAGTSATTFSPNNDCTRAQIVTFLYRALSK